MSTSCRVTNVRVTPDRHRPAARPFRPRRPHPLRYDIHHVIMEAATLPSNRVPGTSPKVIFAALEERIGDRSFTRPCQSGPQYGIWPPCSPSTNESTTYASWPYADTASAKNASPLCFPNKAASTSAVPKVAPATATPPPSSLLRGASAPEHELSSLERTAFHETGQDNLRRRRGYDGARAGPSRKLIHGAGRRRDIDGAAKCGAARRLTRDGGSVRNRRLIDKARCSTPC